MSQSFSSTPLQMTGMSRSMPAYYAHGEATGRPSIPFIVVSCLFHIVALAIVTGQFSLFPKDDDFEDMVVVEMVSEANLAQDVMAPEKKPEALDVPDKPKPAPKSDGVKPTPPETKPEAEAVSEIEAPAPEIVEPKPTPEPTPEVASPPVPPKTVPKPTPPKVEEKPAEETEEIVEEKPKTMDFQSVLKI